VKFISGPESLRALGDAIKAVRLPVVFPLTEPERLVRRALVSCAGGSSPCTLVFYEADNAVRMAFQNR
jgi:hypothetical protein